MRTPMARQQGWRRTPLAIALASLSLAAPAVRALPQGGQPVAGTATISQQGARMTVQQTSPRAIIDWRQFGLAAGESFDLRQPGAQAALLARVTGGQASEIHGRISADGRLYLINPQGVLVGPNGVIDTAGFTASTRDIANAGFMAGQALNFFGTGPGSIDNFGTIQARDGQVLLVGHRVRNTGTISAPAGAVNLVAANDLLLATPDSADFVVRVPAAGGSVTNLGRLQTLQARLDAAGGSVFDLAVAQDDVERATTVRITDGRIELLAPGASPAPTTPPLNLLLGNGPPPGGLPPAPGAAPAPAAAPGPAIDPNAPPLPTLTYTAADKVREYGQADPLFTYRVGGLQGADTAASAVSGEPALWTTASLRSGVGVYTIAIDRGTLSSLRYGFRFVPGVLTVNPAPLTVDIATTRRHYGDANPVFGAAFTGLRAGDLPQDVLPGLRLTSPATPASTVAAYPITQGDLSLASPNYTYTFRPGTLYVDPAPLTVSLRPAARTYGDANPDLRTYVDASGLKNGQTFLDAYPAAWITAEAKPTSPVGSYPVTFAPMTNPNYLLSYGTIAPLQVTRAPLVVNARPASRAYGDADPAFQVASVSGLRNDDSEAVASAGVSLTTDTTGTTPAGTSHAIQARGESANYRFVSGTGQLTITKAPLTVRIDPASRVYGNPDPTFTATYEGLKNGETGVAGFTFTSNASDRSPVGSYTLRPDLVPVFQNYSPVFYASTLTVTPRPLTVTGRDAFRTYGEPNRPMGVNVEGATAWDSAQAAGYWTGSTSATERSNAGRYDVLPVLSPFGAGFDGLGNYSVTLKPGTLTVDRATVLVRATPVNKVWGDGVAPLGYTVVSGLMPWDTPAAAAGAVLASAGTAQEAAPGRYPIVLADATAGTNYRAGLAEVSQVSVTPRPISLSSQVAVPQDALRQPLPGTIDTFTVQRADGGAYQTDVPLPWGPQFTVRAFAQEATGPFAWRTQTAIQPAPGTSLEEVLRYYDVSARPGTATVLPSLTRIDTTLPAPASPLPPIEPDTPPTVARDLAPGAPVPADLLLADTFAGKGALAESARRFLGTPIFRELPQEQNRMLVDALNNELLRDSLQKDVDRIEALLARLRADKSQDWSVLIAATVRDLADARAKRDAVPGVEALRQRTLAGDERARALIMPMMMNELVTQAMSGTLPPYLQDRLVALVNEQRSKTGALVAERAAEWKEAMALRGSSLTSLFSLPMPDLVGGARSDMAKDNLAGASALLGASGGGLAMNAACLAGAAALIPNGNFAVGNFLTAGTGPGIIVAVAVVIGVTAGNQAVQSEENAKRYEEFLRTNQPASSFASLDLSRKDTKFELLTALTSLLGQSFGGPRS